MVTYTYMYIRLQFIGIKMLEPALFVQSIPPLRQAMLFKSTCKNIMEAMTMCAPICSTNIEPGERGSSVSMTFESCCTYSFIIAFAYGLYILYLSIFISIILQYN